jgi:hypothetical protein
LLRQRSLSTRYGKARRGELVVAAPVGFVKAGDRYEKDPDRRVQEAIKLVFDKVEELGSARQALFMVQADIPQTKIILAKEFDPGAAKADCHCGAPVISVTDKKSTLRYQHGQ